MRIISPLTLNIRAGFVLACLLLSLNAAVAQQKRPPAAKSVQKRATSEASPTFDTLLASDSYKIYGEVRGVGQVIRSGSVNELLEPIMKLAGPPKEFKTLVKWLNTHADAVLTSRMLVAGWPTAKNLPYMLVAIEFASPEEAAKFQPELNEFLPKVLPTPAPEGSPTPTDEKRQSSAEKPPQASPAASPTPTAPPKPNYYLKQSGSLILISPTPLKLRDLKPAGSKPLAEDTNFRIVHDRFNSDSIFVYVDVKGIEKEGQDQQKVWQAEAEQARVAEAAREVTPEAAATSQNDGVPSEEVTGVETSSAIVYPGEPPPPFHGLASLERPAKPPEPDPMTTALSAISRAFFSQPTRLPEAIGLAVAFNAEALEIRGLLVNAPDVKSMAIPFIPQLVSGPALVPESPGIFPADAELFVSMSLDLPQMYAGMMKPNRRVNIETTGPMVVTETDVVSPFAVLESKLGIKIKDDLLPLLGNEIVFSMPMKALLPGTPSRTLEPDTKESDKQTTKRAAEPSPVVAISLKDKEGVRALLPRIIDAFGFKGASSLAQSEKREDTEMVSYADVISYAFIGNFLVISPDAAAVRHVVDSYLKHETLSADTHFRNYTRWQPRQLQGQVYVSPALMDSYKSWAIEPSSLISDQTRDFLMRLAVVAEPVTYSLSNEGLGPLHELHVPKNLVLMAVAGFSGEANQPEFVANEQSTRSTVSWIANAEEVFRSKKGAGVYGTLDQLIAEKIIAKDMVENYGYKIEVIVAGSRFEVTAVPIEYGRTGRLSYFIDESKVLRGGDHGGGPATFADKPL